MFAICCEITNSSNVQLKRLSDLDLKHALSQTLLSHANDSKYPTGYRQ